MKNNDDQTTRNGCLGLIVILAIVAVISVATGASGGSNSSTTQQPPNSMYVRRVTWHHGQWPFTVPGGVLACRQPPALGAITFTANGTEYGVNGVADENHYANIHPIWRRAPHGLRIDIGGMIDQGLKLCHS